jgi:hypothetical protein
VVILGWIRRRIGCQKDYACLGLNYLQTKLSLIRKRKNKDGEKANNFVEKRKEKIMLYLAVLLDRIKIRPGRDLTRNKFCIFFNK